MKKKKRQNQLKDCVWWMGKNRCKLTIFVPLIPFCSRGTFGLMSALWGAKSFFATLPTNKKPWTCPQNPKLTTAGTFQFTVRSCSTIKSKKSKVSVGKSSKLGWKLKKVQSSRGYQRLKDNDSFSFYKDPKT